MTGRPCPSFPLESVPFLRCLWMVLRGFPVSLAASEMEIWGMLQTGSLLQNATVARSSISSKAASGLSSTTF